MKNIVLILSFVFLLVLGASAQTAKPSPSPSPSPSPAVGDVSGKWAIVADAGGQSINISMELKQTGTDFTGTLNSDLGPGKIDSGKVTGKTFTAVLHADVQGQTADFKIEGTLDGDKISGTFNNPGFGSVPFSGGRSK